MAEFKLVISNPKDGKSYQRELKDDNAKALVGKKLGEDFKGELIDLPGYEFKITGGSDAAGFPMRWDVDGSQRKQITIVKGVGVHNKLRKPNPKKKGWRTINGMRLKKTVAGNTIYEKTAQINVKILKEGKEKLGGEEEPAAPAEGEAPKEEAKAEAPKEAPKAEEKKEEVKEEPKEEKKEEPKEEKAPEPEKKEEPKEEKKEEPSEEKTDDKLAKDNEEIAKIDEEIKKDEEAAKEATEEIEEIEKELEKEKADAPEEKAEEEKTE